jgi:hypothetical protein
MVEFTHLNDREFRNNLTRVVDDALTIPVSTYNSGGLNSVSNPSFFALGDSPSIDAFARLRVSNPETIFDSKNLYNDADIADNAENIPLFYDNQEVSGSGTSTSYDPNKAQQTLVVGASTAGKRIRQTKMRFNYKPGKSQLVLITFNMHGNDAGIIKQEGLFDDNNGLFLELNGLDTYLVQRTFSSGSAVDTKVAQSNWNVDPFDGTGPSGITLDFDTTQILIIDFEWLGVGRVRMGFVVNGLIYYAHNFNNANNLSVVYMSTPNLPLRSAIENDGTGVSSNLSQICCTVISEGGNTDSGSIRYASTEGTHVDANTENNVYAIMGIRLKTNYIGASVKIMNAALQLHSATSKCEWFLVGNPVVAGTFTYVGESMSACEIARGATANTVTGGIKFGGGFIESQGAQSGSSGSQSKGIENAILLGSAIDGTRDSIVLCIRPIGGSTNVDVEGSLTWRELQ